jgi:hypothetical protein
MIALPGLYFSCLAVVAWGQPGKLDSSEILDLNLRSSEHARFICSVGGRHHNSVALSLITLAQWWLLDSNPGVQVLAIITL